jgi:hypothetical protein
MQALVAKVWEEIHHIYLTTNKNLNTTTTTDRTNSINNNSTSTIRKVTVQPLPPLINSQQIICITNQISFDDCQQLSIVFESLLQQSHQTQQE